MPGHRRLNAILRGLSLAAALALAGNAFVSGAIAQTAPASPANAKDAAAGLAEVSPPPSAPRPQQIEPVVAPVKRVAPKTPVLNGPAAKAAEKGKSGPAANKKAAVIVPSRPNCDAGFKVDDSGKNCVWSASQSSKGKLEGKSVRKKH